MNSTSEASGTLNGVELKVATDSSDIMEPESLELTGSVPPVVVESPEIDDQSSSLLPELTSSEIESSGMPEPSHENVQSTQSEDSGHSEKQWGDPSVWQRCAEGPRQGVVTVMLGISESESDEWVYQGER